MTSPIWISEALARTIHDDQIARYGGSLGIRDESLFLASLDRPRNLFAYGDNPNLFDLAAAYAFGIAKNHPFIDGNKRTAFVLGGLSSIGTKNRVKDSKSFKSQFRSGFAQ
jgi:death on curing protein